MSDNDPKTDSDPQPGGVEEPRVAFEQGADASRDEVLASARRIMERYAPALRELAK